MAMLTALGLPGGGIARVGNTHVRVLPGDVRSPNELLLPMFAFSNGAGEPGSVVDVGRAVVPLARMCQIAVDGSPVDSVPGDLLGLPVQQGEEYPSGAGRARIVDLSPGPCAVLAPETIVRENTESPTGPRSDSSKPVGDIGSALIVGLDNELDLLTGWLGLLTGDTLPGASVGAGIVVSGPQGSGRRDLIAAAAAASGLRVVPIDLRTVTTPERLLATFERALNRATDGTLLAIDRLDPLVERQGGVSHQAAAVTRWLLDTAASTPGVAVAIATSRDALAEDLDAADLLRKTLTIAPPDHTRRRAVLEALLADQAGIDIDTITNATAGFSAHDISTAILDARAMNGRSLTMDILLAAVRATTPSLGTASLGSLPSYGFDKVANLIDVKQALTESVIWQLTDPGRFDRMGIEPARGLLLHGPPGTGKTFVIRALAHESGAAFFSVKGAELLDKWVGESERGVREVFARARSVAPAIIFFDEIDALAPVRGSSTNSVTDSVVAALLTELDGVSDRGDVFVIGATNRKDLVDPALLRPGRLEVHLLLDLPAPESRRAFLDITDVPLADDVDIDRLVDETDGLSFADLEGLLRSAAILAMRRDTHASLVTWSDISKALESRFNPGD